MRCLALARAWQAAGGQAAIIPSTPTTAIGDLAARAGVTETVCEQPCAPDASLATVLDAAPEGAWVAVDGYRFTREFESALRAVGRRVLVIDDVAERLVHDADVLLNQNLGAEGLVYEVPAGARTLFGPAYALLHPEFSAASRTRQAADEVRHVLVTFGGSDVRGLSPFMVEAARDALGSHVIIKVVVGPDSASPVHRALAANELERAPDPARMAELLTWADLAVAAAGSTTWELCACGVPAVIVPVADNQRGIASELDRHGAAVSLGWYEALSPDRVRSAILDVAHDRERRQRLIDAGQRMVDGRGADRVVDVMRGMPRFPAVPS